MVLNRLPIRSKAYNFLSLYPTKKYDNKFAEEERKLLGPALWHTIISSLGFTGKKHLIFEQTNIGASISVGRYHRQKKLKTTATNFCSEVSKLAKTMAVF